MQKQLELTWKSALRERGKRRTAALEAWLRGAGDDGVSYLASVAFGGGAVSHRKAALSQLTAVVWAGRAQGGAVGARALERGGKAAMALFERVVAEGQGEQIGEAIRGRLGWLGAADAVKMVERTHEPAILHALAQHWSGEASGVALASLGDAARDPWRGCRLNEHARRGLAYARATTSPPLEPPGVVGEWLVASVRWPDGTFWHSRLDQDATWAYEGQLEIERGGQTYVCFAWVALHQYYFAFLRDDTSPDPTVYEVDHDSTLRGVGWKKLSLMFDRMRFGRRSE